MTTSTPTLSLTLYDSIAPDTNATFSSYRAVQSGTAVSSNMYKIDTAIGADRTRITALESQRGAILVSATWVSLGTYSATVSEITALTTNMTIILKVDTTSDGSMLLDISSLGSKTVAKINSAGTVINIVAGDLIIGRNYLFRYDGTQWIWVSATDAMFIQETIVASTAKTTLTGADLISLIDSAASNVLKKITWTNFLTAIGAGIGSVVAALTGKTTPVDADTFVISDSAASGVSKSLTFANLKSNLPNNRNVIINGAMDIWQRGTTTLVNPVDGSYSVDRFQVAHILGDGIFNLLQSAETPSSVFPFQYSLQHDTTSVETTVNATEVSGIVYRMEGYDFKRLEGNTATLSFWVKSVKVGIFCVTFRNNAQNKSYVHEFTINASNVWEKKTVTLTFNSGGVFLYTSGCGLIITWTVMCGSTFTTSTSNKDTWVSGNYYASDAQVNGMDNVANNFYLTGVQLELGSVATPFEFRHYAQELALCQRYYEEAKTDVSTTRTGMAFIGSFIQGFNFIVPKRVAPTVTIYSRSNTVSKVSLASSGADVGTAATASSISTQGVHDVQDAGAPYTIGSIYEMNYTASAEL